MWKEALAALGQTDQQYWKLQRRLRRLVGQPSLLEIVPYRGFGTPETLRMYGRLLVQREVPPDDDLSTWDNVLAMYRRFASEEIPGRTITAQVDGQTFTTTTDDEGYFTFELSAAAPYPPGWQTVEFTTEPLDPAHAPLSAEGTALVPQPDARYAIVSDIDDTVLQTNATSLLQMARTTLLNNAETRLPFAGVAELYSALRTGVDGRQQNPIFYLSSSPWNLYDLLVDFMRLNRIPDGPLILQDYGFDEEKVLKLSHEGHKLARLRELLTLYPNLPFILIGDSGEHDPELYAQIIQEFPGRVKAVYIRDVSEDRRDADVEELGRRAAEDDVDLLLVPDSAAAAHHAAAQGLINPTALTAIEAATAEV